MGKLTDNYESCWGKRRPWLVAGTLLCVACIAVMGHASLTGAPWAYIFALLVGMSALNVVYTAQAAMVRPANFDQCP